MPYAMPTLATLIEQAQSDINSASIIDAQGNTIDGFLEVGIVPVVTGVTLPGLAFGHYGYQAWIAQQAVPWTATGEFWTGWAALKGVTQEPATQTTGTASFAGSPNGTDVPNGTGLTRSDGAGFTSTADAVVSAGAVVVPMIANVAGSAGNFAGGTTFYLANQIAGIASKSTTSAQVTPGADQETFAAFKTRGLAVYASPPQGGDAQDYIEWATGVAGVTRAWVNPNGFGAGTVVVFFMMDIAESAFGGFPQGTGGVATNEPRDTPATGDQLAVANAIYPVQPVTALVYAEAPSSDAIAFTINGLGTNNTTAMQTAIVAALTDMFLRLGNVGGTVNPQTKAAWPSIQPSAWYEALGAIPGLTTFSVGVPSSPITPSAGALPVLGAMTYNT